MKTGKEATLVVIRALEEAGIRYMVVGSFSSNFYGIPRSTQDADFVVELEERDLERLLEKLPPGFAPDPQVSFETVTGTTRTILEIPSLQFKIELFDLGTDSHDQERFARRRRVEFEGLETFLPTPEDVVIQKLRWCRGGNRSKDYNDVRDVMSVQGVSLDWEYLRGWCGKHGTLELLEEVREATRGI